MGDAAERMDDGDDAAEATFRRGGSKIEDG